MREPVSADKRISLDDVRKYFSKKRIVTHKELVEKFLANNRYYDKDGISHRIRHILYGMKNQGEITLVKRGTYKVKKLIKNF